MPDRLTGIDLARRQAIKEGRDPSRIFKGNSPGSVFGAVQGDWVCELHPEFPFPHPGCSGQGMPKANQVRALVTQRDGARTQRDAFQKAVDEILPILDSARPGQVKDRLDEAQKEADAASAGDAIAVDAAVETERP